MPDHFHVASNDVGYMPDGDSYTTVDFESAFNACLEEAKCHIDASGELDQTMAVRGSSTYTIAEDIVETQRQIDAFRSMMLDDFANLYRNGFCIIVENGLHHIWCEPCNDPECMGHDN